MTQVVAYKPMSVIPYQQLPVGSGTCTGLYVWGQTGNDQLGTAPNEDGYLLEPTHLPLFDGYVVKDVAVGSRHSLFLTLSGLYSSGCNECGQLGHSKNETTPGLVNSPFWEGRTVVAVAVGENHSLALSSDGLVFSWGSNQYGQLGVVCENSIEPKKISFPNNVPIVQITSGENHCLALAKDGALYTWGSNTNGQLGHGSSGSYITEPRVLSSVRSLHFTKICAGSAHSFALTISGALFGWGSNRNGQLGLGNDEDKPFPTCCRALRQQKIKHIACGRDHTAALTTDGGVFTFGAGYNGQLGHNLSTDEHLPKKVLELMGSTVTQIVCGRNHTMAFVPANDRIYIFGLGAFGQLGLSDLNKRLAPTRMRGPWEQSGDPTVGLHVKKICAGGNSSAAYLEEQNSTLTNPVDHRCTPANQLYVINTEVIQLIAASCNTKPRSSLKEELVITSVFSYLSAWSGAFLTEKDSHYGCGSTNHGLDLDKAKEQLSLLSGCRNMVISQLMMSCMERNLLPSLRHQIPDVEALRAFLILPFLPVFLEPTNFNTVQCPYGHALILLDKNASNIMDKWLARIPRRHFKYYLSVFRDVLSHLITLGQTSTEYEALEIERSKQVSLEVMKKLYTINESESENMVSCTDFYIPKIADRVNIKFDYITWHNVMAQNLINKEGIVSFCNYPFIFDALAKTVLLNADAHLQMQQAINEAHRRNLMNILAMPVIDPVHPCLVVKVSRDNLLIDTLNSLAQHSSADLKKPLKVQFLNEEGVDEGGVKKEFFLLLIREVLDPKYGMFRYYDESRLLWINSRSFDEPVMYHLVGLLCGLAIYNTIIVDLPFPLAMYKKLLNRPVNLDDLRELDPILGKSLQDLLDYEEQDEDGYNAASVEEVFCLTMSIACDNYGQTVIDDLIPNGRNIPVSSENKQEYVNAYVDYVFNSSVKPMFDAFHDGFHKVCGGRVLSFFHPLELQAMIVGNQEYNWAELEKNCDYKGEFYRYHPTIDMFWQVFNDLPQDKKRQFLLFLTGSDRIPIQGMRSLKMTIQPMNVSDGYLPVAHTCFNLLDLPKTYSSQEKLREKLLHAVENTEGFGIV